MKMHRDKIMNGEDLFVRSGIKEFLYSACFPIVRQLCLLSRESQSYEDVDKRLLYPFLFLTVPEQQEGMRIRLNDKISS